MIKSIFSLLVIPFLACAGAFEPPATPPVEEPLVMTGAKLVFEGTYGDTANLISPAGVVCGPENTIYVSDRGKNSIIRLDRSGKVIGSWDGHSWRRAVVPSTLQWDGIHLWAVDEAGSRLLRLDRNLHTAAVFYEGISEDKRLYGTFYGVAVERNSGNVFLTDRQTGSIIRIDMNRGSKRTMGAFGEGRKSLVHPLGIAVTDEEMLFIADEKAGAVALVEHFGGAINYIGQNTLEAPQDVTIIKGRRIAVADVRGVRVMSFDGTVLASAGYNENSMRPVSISYCNGKLYVTDSLTSSVLVYNVQ